MKTAAFGLDLYGLSWQSCEQIYLAQALLGFRVGAHEGLSEAEVAPQEGNGTALGHTPASQLAAMASGGFIPDLSHASTVDAGVDGKIPLLQQTGQVDIPVAPEVVWVHAQQWGQPDRPSYELLGHGLVIQLIWFEGRQIGCIAFIA